MRDPSYVRTRDALVASMPSSTLRVRVAAPQEALERQLGELFPGRALSIELQDGGVLCCRVDIGAAKAPVEEAVARLVVKNNWSLLELVRERSSLEDVFRRLTTEPANETTATEAAHA